MNGLVGGPLLVGGLGPGAPAPPPLNPDLTGPEHSVCCYNPSIVKHDRRLAVITYTRSTRKTAHTRWTVGRRRFHWPRPRHAARLAVLARS